MAGLLEPSPQGDAATVRRFAIAFVSIGALMLLFYSFQGSDVSTQNGIATRRLPPDVKNGGKGQPLSKYVSAAWLAREHKGVDDDRLEEEDDYANDYAEEDEYDDDDEYDARTRAASSSRASPPPPTTTAAKEKDKKKKKGKKNNKNNKTESCDVNPAPPGVYVHGHGPCITQFPHQPAALGGMDDCWRLAFAVAQWGQPKNPSKAEYGDDWEATARAYPHTAAQAQQVVEDFNTKTELPVSSEWSPEHPYVRLCVPTACGLSATSGCGLKETDFLMHINPNSKDDDDTTHLFYKGFIRDGHIMLPNAGLTGH